MVKTTLFILSPDFPEIDDCAMPAGEYADSVRLAMELGYDGVEVIMGDPEKFDVSGFKKILSENNACISAINCGGIEYYFKASLVNADPAKEEFAKKKLAQIIEICGQFGCYSQVGVARGFAVEQLPYRRFKDRLVGCLQEMAAYAGKRGVQMVLEYTNRLEINTINIFDEARDIVDRVAAANLGILMDTYHSWYDDEDTYEVMRRGKEYIKHFHLHDSNRGPAGSSKGELDFDKVFDILAENRYQHNLSDGLLTLSVPREQVLASTKYLREKIREKNL